MIDTWREKIDRVDERILGLLNERAALSTRIGRFKYEVRLPFYCPEREEEILQVMKSNNPGPLDSDAVARIFRTIIEESRALSSGCGTTGRKES